MRYAIESHLRVLLVTENFVHLRSDFADTRTVNDLDCLVAQADNAHCFKILGEHLVVCNLRTILDNHAKTRDAVIKIINVVGSTKRFDNVDSKRAVLGRTVLDCLLGSATRLALCLSGLCLELSSAVDQLNIVTIISTGRLDIELSNKEPEEEESCQEKGGEQNKVRKQIKLLGAE